MGINEELEKHSIFLFDKKYYSRYVKKCIAAATSEDEEVINIPKLVQRLGFRVKFEDMDDKAIIDYDGIQNYATLTISKSLKPEDKNAIAVLIIAEFFVRFRRGQRKRIVFDMFYLSNIKQIRMSKQVFLATRLAIPERIITKLDNFNSDKLGYSQKSKLPVYFLDLARKRKSVELYLEFTDNDFTQWLNEIWRRF